MRLLQAARPARQGRRRRAGPGHHPRPCRRVVRRHGQGHRRWRRAQHAQYRKRPDLLIPHERPTMSAPVTTQLDHDHRQRRQLRRATWRCRRPAAARACCCCRRSSASTSTSAAWPSSTRWTASWCWRPMCSGAAGAALELGYDGARPPARPRADAMAADRDALRRPGRQRCGAARAARGRRAAASAPSATAWAGAWPTWPRPRPASMPRWPTTAAASRTMLELAPRIACPMQFHYGELDDQHPARAQWTRCAPRCGRQAAEVHVYAGADHGFNCWARGSYHAASAALAHGRALQFLASKLF